MRLILLSALMLIFPHASLGATDNRPSAVVYSCFVINTTSITCPSKSAKCKSEANNSPSKKNEFGIRIAGPESDEPVLLGNQGNTMLTLIRATQDLSVMSETSDTGNVFLWTWLKRSKRIFQVKSYDLLGEDFSVTVLYQCNSL